VIQFHDAMIKLFLEVFKAYVERKNEKVLVPQRVVRGTSVSNSSIFENQLALLLHSQIHEDYKILVDYPIIFPGQNNRITPDIIILKDNTIHMILELKVDLGYEKKGWEEERDKRLGKLKKYQNQTSYKPFNEQTKEKVEKVFINVPDQIECQDQKKVPQKNQAKIPQ